MHCQGITQYWVHNLLGRSVFLDKKESKKQCTLLRGTIRWRRTTSNLLLITKFEMFLHNVKQIFFNIRGWAIFGEICLKIGIFGVTIWEWYFIRAWACNRDFTVYIYTSLQSVSLVSCIQISPLDSYDIFRVCLLLFLSFFGLA